MSLHLSDATDPNGDLRHVTGDNVEKTITIFHESAREAAAQVQEAFGYKAYRPPPPPPPDHHRFALMDTWIGAGDGRPDDPATMPSNPIFHRAAL
ncbi:hypothetical protein [Nocardia inohanensis]|uniref:hypothetical protein n=1 Tax=Nocardia inohanensis TaxID=209246 RepID=UPI0012F9278F|nr:hypothetical protein [Nocardia inohanensis]